MSSSRKRRGSDSAHSENSRLQKVLVLGDNDETFKDHIKRLESQLASQEVSYNQQIESFNETNKHLLRRITTLDNTNQELIQRIETLDESIGHYRQLADENRNKDRIKRLELDWASQELSYKQQIGSLSETNKQLAQRLAILDEAVGQEGQFADGDRDYEKKRKKTAAGPIREQGLRRDNTPEYHKSLRDRDKNQWKQKELGYQREIDKLKAQVELGNPKVNSPAKGKSTDGTADAKDLVNRLRRSEETRKALEEQIAQMKEEEAVNSPTQRIQASGDKASELETLNRELEAEVIAQKEQLADMQQDKETVSREQDAALAREHEMAGKLHISDEALQRHMRNVEELQASLTDSETAHEALLTKCTALDEHISTLRREKESVIQERDNALAREHEVAGKLHISDEALQSHTRNLEELQALLTDSKSAHGALLIKHIALEQQLQTDSSNPDGRIASLLKEREPLIQERDEALAREHEMAGKLRISDDALKKQMQNLEELQTSLTDAGTAHKALLTEYTALDEHITVLRTEKESLIQERDDALAREHEKARKLRISDETLQKHMQNLEDSQVSLTDSEAAHKVLLAENAALEKHITMLRTEHESVIQERDEALARQQETAGKLRSSDEALQKHLQNLKQSRVTLNDTEAAHKALLTEYTALDEHITVLRTEKESLIQERDEALAREHEMAGKLRISDDTLKKHMRNLEGLKASLADAETAHEAHLNEYTALDEHITVLRTEKESLIQERDDALAREHEKARKLRISDEALHEHMQNLEESQASLSNLEAVHKALLSEYSTLKGRSKEGHASRDQRITILETKQATLVRELDEVAASSKRAQQLAFDERDAALSRELKMSEKLQISQEALQRQIERVTVLQRAPRTCNQEQVEALDESQSHIRNLRRALEEKEKVILELQGLRQRDQVELRQVHEDSHTVQSRYNDIVRKYDKEHNVLRNKLSQALTERVMFIVDDEVTQVIPNLHISATSDRKDSTGSMKGTYPTPGLPSPRPQHRQSGPRTFQDDNQQGSPPNASTSTSQNPTGQGVPAQDHGGNSLVDYFKKETLRGANIIKETKHAQRALYKYELVSPIPAPNARPASINHNKKKPWQKRTGRSPYVNLQPREPSVSPSSSSSDSSSSEEGEGDTEEVKGENDHNQ